MVRPRAGDDGAVDSTFQPWSPLPPVEAVVDRRAFLVERARGRRVVHLGCVDEHLTDQRLTSGELLHANLAEVATELVGVDLSRDGLDALAAAVPGHYIHGDVERLNDLALPAGCDLVVAAEIIEHLGAPHAFLCGLQSYLRTTGATALITTPNAFSWTNWVRFAARRREWVHPDHRAAYTPVTMERALAAAGLVATAWWSHRWIRRGGLPRRLLDAVDATVTRWNPWLGLGLVVEVRPAPSA